MITIRSQHDRDIRAYVAETEDGVRVDMWVNTQVTRRVFDLPFHLVADRVYDLLNNQPGR